MMSTNRILARLCAMIAPLVAMLAGCSGGVKPYAVAPRPLGADVAVYRPEPRDTARTMGPAFVEPTDTITLQDAVRLALLHNPELAAFAWEKRAGDARAAQAGRLPNPTIELLAEDLGATRSASSTQQPVQRQTTIALSQLVELGGERAARRRGADRERELAEWDYEAARLNVLTGVTHAYIDVLAAQAMVTLTRQTTNLATQVEQTVSARVTAGMVSPIEATRAEVALAAARVESDRALRLLNASRERLTTFWGGTSTAFSGATGELGTMRDLPPIDALRVKLEQNPDLARWAVEISRRQTALAFSKARRIPDVTVSGGYRRFNDLDNSAYVVGISLQLPLFDRNSGGIAEARSLVNKAYEEKRAAEARVSSDLFAAYRDLSSAQQEINALRETVLPGARQTFELITEGYRLGKFNLVDVLDAQRTLIATEGQYLRALSDYHKAVASVERLVGAPLAQVSGSPR